MPGRDPRCWSDPRVWTFVGRRDGRKDHASSSSGQGQKLRRKQNLLRKRRRTNPPFPPRPLLETTTSTKPRFSSNSPRRNCSTWRSSAVPLLPRFDRGRSRPAAPPPPPQSEGPRWRRRVRARSGEIRSGIKLQSSPAWREDRDSGSDQSATCPMSDYMGALHSLPKIPEARPRSSRHSFPSVRRARPPHSSSTPTPCCSLFSGTSAAPTSVQDAPFFPRCCTLRSHSRSGRTHPPHRGNTDWRSWSCRHHEGDLF